MPNCYYVVSSTPESTGPDAAECARRHGGVPRLIAREKKQKRRFVVLVWFESREDADENVDKIKDCLEEKGHTVHESDVLEDVRTLGITVEGYEPYSSD